MIPTSTGARAAVIGAAAHAGQAGRQRDPVPTADVSMVDFTFDAARDTTPEEINGAISAAAAAGLLKGIPPPMTKSLCRSTSPTTRPLRSSA